MQNQKDEWIGRNILKINSQSENNNQKHWKAKRAMPFQGRESDLCLPLLLFFEQPFTLLFWSKGFNFPPAHSKFKPGGPGPRFGSDTAHCLNTGQLSSRCLFLNRALLYCNFQAVLSSYYVKAEKSIWRPVPATAWLELVAACA